MPTLRAAVVTDIHYGFDIKDKLGSKAPRLMDKFVKAVNKFSPDFVVDMGDRVSAQDKLSDTQYMKDLKNHFNQVAAPVYSTIGNHDIRHLTRDENEAIMGTPSDSYSQDINGYHLIFWNPEWHFTEDGIELGLKDIQWLEQDLKNSGGKPAVLFSHVPLDNLDGEESKDIRKFFWWSQGEDVRKILEDSGNVILCMAGHQHKNRHREINGIHYITQQSLVSMWKDHYRVPSGSFSFLEIDKDKIKIELQGKVQKTYDLAPKALP